MIVSSRRVAMASRRSGRSLSLHREAHRFGVFACLKSRNSDGIRYFLQRLSSAHQRVADLRGGHFRDRAGRSARLSRRLYQRAPWRTDLYGQGRHPARAGTADVQGGGADQAHSHGRGGEAHSSCPPRRYRDPGGGDRSRDGQRPVHLRLRLRISQSAVRGRARPLARRPPSAPAGVPRSDPEMLDLGGAVRLGREILARQEHRCHAAPAAQAAYADGDRDRHRGDDRACGPARLHAALGAARARRIHPQEGRPLRARRARPPAENGRSIRSPWRATSTSRIPGPRQWTICVPSSPTSSASR